MGRKLTSEAVRLRFRDEVYIPTLRNFWRKQLTVTDFTIISNNCWGGTVYESFGLQKQTPTAGMFIMPEDFLALAVDLDLYLSEKLEFIQPVDSKWKSVLENKSNWGSYLIGVVGDIELHMLHYHDEQSARRKWESRVQRVNRQNLIFKFNDQNGATEDHLRTFDNLGVENKIAFTVRQLPDVKSAITLHAPSDHRYVRASYEPIGWMKSFNVTGYINSCFAPPS